MLPAVVPVYWAGDDVEDFRHGRANVAALSLATISNLPRGSGLLWLPFLAAMAASAICCWLLTIHCQVRGPRAAAMPTAAPAM